MNALGRQGGAFSPLAPSPVELKRQSKTEPLVYDQVLAKLCPELEEAILILASRGRSGPSLNKGGWKSTDTFLASYRSQVPAIAAMDDYLRQMVGARPTASWAMVNANGSNHKRHQHRGAIVSTVFYVTAGDPLTPTIWECADGSEMEVVPHPGRLVICPGEMWHRVPTYPGETPRITIAADFRRAQ